MLKRGLLVLIGVTALALSLMLLGDLPGQTTPAVVVAQEDTDVTFTVGETTLESHYPRGMTFSVEAESSAGDITRATLFYELRTGLRQRENADPDMETGKWTARPYTVRGGLPPWVDFHYWWSLTDAEGNNYETEPIYGVYEDNTREWMSIDTDEITMYWFGGMPDLGEAISEAMAQTREYYELGWGRTISYKPLAIIFPDGTVWNEYVEGGVNPNAAGFTQPSEGFTVQRIPGLRSVSQHEATRDRCGGYWYGNRENTPEEWRLADMVHTILHETTHLYQADFRMSGPQFWTEGQADYFSSLYGWHNRDADSRMLAYGAAGYDLPTLQGSQMGGGSTAAADGCRAIGYAVGETFIRFIVTNFGGLEVHREILEALPGNGVEKAIEEVLGMPFVDVENQYRTFLGLPPVEILPTPTPFTFPTAPVIAIPTAPGGSGN
jgi:hypothetical protein